MTRRSIMDLIDFSNTWAERKGAILEYRSILKNGLQDILERNSRLLVFEELYRASYNMVLFGHGEMVYNGIKEIVTHILKLKIREKVLLAVQDDFLQTLESELTYYQTALGLISNITLYLERVNQKKKTNKKSICDLGLLFFIDHVVRDDIIRERLSQTLLEVAACERRGEIADMQKYHTARQILLQLGIKNDGSVYKEIFEIPFLHQLVGFYKMESQRYLLENNTFYETRLQALIAKERKRVKKYFAVTIDPQVVAVLEQELIQYKKSTIVEVRENVLQSQHNDFLKSLNTALVYHRLNMVTIYNILKYLDELYVLQNDIANLCDLELELFTNQVVRYDDIKKRLSQTLLELVACERLGKMADRESFELARKILLQLGNKNYNSIYEDIFERPYIQELVEFYKMEFLRYLVEYNTLYITQLKPTITEELKRAMKHLDATSVSQIVAVLKQEFIRHHGNTEFQVRRNISLDNNYIPSIDTALTDHRLSMVIIYNILKYLNESHVLQNNDVNLCDLELVIFTNQVLCYRGIKEHLSKTLLEVVNRERLGEIETREVSDTACKMLSLLDSKNYRSLYGDIPEGPFLQECVEFNKMKSLRDLPEISTVDTTPVHAIITKERKLTLGAKNDSQIVVMLIQELPQYHENIKFQVRGNLLQSLDNYFLSSLSAALLTHQLNMAVMYHILRYLDEPYVLQNDVANLCDLGSVAFTKQVVLYDDIRKRLSQTLLELVACERMGKKADRESFELAQMILLQLGSKNYRNLYEVVFEKPYLQELEEFCKNKSKYLLENGTGYIERVDAINTEERKIARKYLVATDSQIVAVLKREFIEQHMETIVRKENGVVHMLRNTKTNELCRLYHFLARVVGGTFVMNNAVSSFLREEGQALIEKNTDKTDAIVYVQNVLNLKDQFDHFLHKSFNNDKIFKHMIGEDFEYILNLNTKSPEYISLFIDDILKKGLKEMSAQEIEAVLNKIMVLFRFLQAKDIFERYYKLHLAKRLLQNKSILDDSEKNMISKLKTECGCQYTSKLNGMFKDMSVSNTIMEEFKEHITTTGASLHGVDLSVRVLTTGFWPFRSDTSNCTIPAAPRNAFDAFKQFYLGKHSGRRILLQPQLGNAELNAVFRDPACAGESSITPGGDSIGSNGSQAIVMNRKYIIQVSTYQMFVLLLFNNRDKLTYEEIKNEMDIPEKELVLVLQSLISGKTAQQILLKQPKTKKIEPMHVFFVNDSFTSKLDRVKIQTVTAKGESERERREMRSKVDEDRRHEIEAAIVRIMKAGKKMTHNILLTEVTDQLRSRFLPSPIIIKKRIENLIEREYLMRTPDDCKSYKYVA